MQRKTEKFKITLLCDYTHKVKTLHKNILKIVSNQPVYLLKNKLMLISLSRLAICCRGNSSVPSNPIILALGHFFLDSLHCPLLCMNSCLTIWGLCQFNKLNN